MSLVSSLSLPGLPADCPLLYFLDWSFSNACRCNREGFSPPSPIVPLPSDHCSDSSTPNVLLCSIRYLLGVPCREPFRDVTVGRNGLILERRVRHSRRRRRDSIRQSRATKPIRGNIGFAPDVVSVILLCGLSLRSTMQSNSVKNHHCGSLIQWG